MIAGTVGQHRTTRYTRGGATAFYELLHGSGLVDERLDPDTASRLPGLGVGITDLVLERVDGAGHEPEVLIHRRGVRPRDPHVGPTVVAFVSKTAATWYARGAVERLPQGYGELSWAVAGVPAFVLPGRSGRQTTGCRSPCASRCGPTWPTSSSSWRVPVTRAWRTA